MRKFVTLGAIVLTLATLLTTCGYERIDAGHVGVQVDLYGSDKGVQGVTRVTGAQWYNKWTTAIYEFPTFIQHKEYKGEDGFVVNTSDGSEFIVNPIINYYVNVEKVPEIFSKYRKPLPEIEDGFIKTAVYDAFRIATNTYSADSLISNRQSYEKRVREILEKELGTEGFLTQQFTSNLTYPETYKKAIESKNAAVQEALQAENKVAKAIADAKTKVAKAKGDSAQLVTNAAAEAKANQLRQNSLTDKLLNQLWIEKWDGKLPNTMTGANSNLLITPTK